MAAPAHYSWDADGLTPLTGSAIDVLLPKTKRPETDGHKEAVLCFTYREYPRDNEIVQLEWKIMGSCLAWAALPVTDFVYVQADPPSDNSENWKKGYERFLRTGIRARHASPKRDEASQDTVKRAKHSGILFTSCDIWSLVINATVQAKEKALLLKRSQMNMPKSKESFGRKPAAPSNGIGLLDHELPSVVQIRAHGVKGVLTLDPTLQGNKAVLRSSMLKFHSDYSSSWTSTPPTPCNFRVGIKSYSSAPRARFTKVGEQELLQLNARNISIDAIREKHLRRGTDGRLQIKLEKARRPLGVADYSGTLKSGQCFFQPTINGTPTALYGTVAVMRNPCYHPGDIRILRAVPCPALCHLRDCVVFPVLGDRPHPDEMSGGDLDGDQYLVIWDPDLIPRSHAVPFDYRSQSASFTIGADFGNHISYFVQSDNNLLARINSVLLKLAACPAHGPFSELSEKANRLFSLGVDNQNFPRKELEVLEAEVAGLQVDKGHFLYMECAIGDEDGEDEVDGGMEVVEEDRKGIEFWSEEMRFNEALKVTVDLSKVARELIKGGVEKAIRKAGGDRLKDVESRLITEARTSFELKKNNLKRFYHSYAEYSSALHKFGKAFEHGNAAGDKLESFRSSPTYRNALRDKDEWDECNQQFTRNPESFADPWQAQKELSIYFEAQAKALEMETALEEECEKWAKALLWTASQSRNSDSEFRTRGMMFALSYVQYLRRLQELQSSSPYRSLQVLRRSVQSFDNRLATNEITPLEFLSLISHELVQFQTRLPIYDQKHIILDAVIRNRVVLLVAETRSGKSTQVPQYILDHLIPSSSNPSSSATPALGGKKSPRDFVAIRVTQPRRLAATRIASRIAKERQTILGTEIGYHIGRETPFTHKNSVPTRLELNTMGILLNQLTNPHQSLQHVRYIIVDEAHERSLEADLGLALLKKALTILPHLKLIIMSAGFDATTYSEYFGGAPIVRCVGRTFPVDVQWDEECGLGRGRDMDEVVGRAVEKVVEILEAERGVFRSLEEVEREREREEKEKEWQVKVTYVNGKKGKRKGRKGKGRGMLGEEEVGKGAVEMLPEDEGHSRPNKSAPANLNAGAEIGDLNHKVADARPYPRLFHVTKERRNVMKEHVKAILKQNANLEAVQSEPEDTCINPSQPHQILKWGQNDVIEGTLSTASLTLNGGSATKAALTSLGNAEWLTVSDEHSSNSGDLLDLEDETACSSSDGFDDEQHAFNITSFEKFARGYALFAFDAGVGPPGFNPDHWSGADWDAWIDELLIRVFGDGSEEDLAHGGTKGAVAGDELLRDSWKYYKKERTLVGCFESFELETDVDDVPAPAPDDDLVNDVPPLTPDNDFVDDILAHI
ncbi:Protein rrf1 [Rhizophlyctis rosea]|nr:Protein rrf1 [Rhizophlyctis rosea]